MGVLFGYYAAADDHHAARAVEREDDQPVGTGYDELVVKDIDPVVCLVRAEMLVTGRSQAEIDGDPRHTHLVATADDGDIVSVALTDALRDGLAAFDRELLGDVARAWAASDAFWSPPDANGVKDLTDFLRRLADLATRAATRGHRLYCWICP